jgi:fatty-acyl-CoA synthase
MATDLAGDWVAFHAERSPDRAALINADDGNRTTWSALHDRVGRLATVLSEEFGIVPGDRVLVLAENDPRVFEVQFACMRVGAIFTPLNWRLARSDLESLVGHAGPSLIVHDGAVAEMATHLSAAHDLPVMSWDHPGAVRDYEKELSGAGPFAGAVGRTLEEPTHILYTTGSTGTPKGVTLSRKTTIWNLLNIQQDKAVTGPDSRMFNPLPLFHGGGLTALAYPILLSGGSVAVARRFEPEQAVRIVGDPAQGMTHFTGVLTIYQMMTEAKSWARADFSSVRYMEFAGGRLPKHIFEAFEAKGVILQSVYGATETGPAVTQMPRDDARRKLGSIGRAVPHSRVRLVDALGHDVVRGEIGELWVSGPSITTGYWDAPDQTAAAFETPWFMTGDAAYQDDEGFYFAVDRFKNMYKTGGENVYPAEVEAMLIEHPNIAEIAIIGIADAKWGETGLAVAVTRDGADLTLEEIARFCGDRIARFKLPTRVVTVAEIPHHDSGKRDLRRLRRDFA